MLIALSAAVGAAFRGPRPGVGGTLRLDQYGIVRRVSLSPSSLHRGVPAAIRQSTALYWVVSVA